MPSFTEITVGSDISRGKFLSPFLDDISKFKCYIVGDDDVVKDFGLIDHLAI